MNLPPPCDPIVCWHITLTLFHVIWFGLLLAGIAASGNFWLRGAAASRRHALNFGAMLALGISMPAALAVVILTAPRAIETLSVAAIQTSETNVIATTSLPDRVVAVEGSTADWLNLRATSPYIAMLYVFGVAAMLTKLMVSLYGVQRLRAAGRPITDSQLLEIVARQCRRLGLCLVPVVGCCERVAVPVVLGVVRPMILLPASLLTGLDSEQLAAVLTHELAHIRRHDHLLIIVQRLIEAVLFFHPAVWYLSRCVHQERESSCDDLVLAAGGDRLGYCQSLLHVAELRLVGQKRVEQLIILAVDGGEPSRLRRRISRLLGVADGPAIHPTRAGLVVGALLVVVAGSVYFSLSRPGKPNRAMLVPGRSDTVEITAERMDAPGIRLEAVAQAGPQSLRLHGQLVLDPDRLARVRSRCKGEVVEVGFPAAEREHVVEVAGRRELSYGDRIHKGDILAIISSDERETKRRLIGNRPDPSVDDSPQNVEILAPIDGLIVEKNFNRGSYIDTTDILFQIADLSQLMVMANVYEEQLPGLRLLTSEERKWRIGLKSRSDGKSIDGTFDLTGQIIDPGSHTAVIMGWIDNTANELAAGQFITATIDLPADPSLVVIPGSALIDEQDLSAVFVETDADHREFTRRKVCVRHRDGESVFISVQPTDDERARGAEPLHVGERVVVSGVLELAAKLKDVQPRAKSQ